MERTLILIKPDAVQRGLSGEIIARFERRGLRIAGMKLMQIDEPLARRHYAVHEGKPFYEPLVRFITAGPVVAMVLEGDDAIEIVRSIIGATSPTEALPGTVRAEFAMSTRRNLVHSSDSPETAAFEIPLFFSESEILSYVRDNDRWIFDSVAESSRVP